MSVSGWFLLLAAIVCTATLVTLRPPKRPQWLMAVTFFTGWLNTELAAWQIAWQVLATIVFVAAGALDAWTGWLGLALMVVSWSGLVVLVAGARHTSAAFAAALDEGLGAGWGDELDPNWKPVPAPFEWRRIALPFAMRRRGVSRVTGVQYVEGERARRHQLDIYRNENAGPGAPVLLQIHGGAWVIGNKTQQGLPLMYHLAQRGWVCVAINYRLAPRAAWPAQIVDCKRALAWVRTHIAEYGGDPNYVVVTGGSAGGHLTALMGLTANDPEWQPGFEHVDTSVRAMVPFYGVYDWTNRFDQRGRRDGLRRVLERTIVKQRYSEHPDVFDRASPLSRVRPDAPPALIVHGDRDTLAPVVEAREFAQRLREASREPVVYAELHGATHAFEIFQSIRTLQTIAAVDLFVTWLLTHHPPPAVQRLAEVEAPSQSSDAVGR